MGFPPLAAYWTKTPAKPTTKPVTFFGVRAKDAARWYYPAGLAAPISPRPVGPLARPEIGNAGAGGSWSFCIQAGRKPPPRLLKTEFDEALQQVEHWGLDPHLKEQGFESLVPSAAA
jgi:hypothetical protein